MNFKNIVRFALVAIVAVGFCALPAMAAEQTGQATVVEKPSSLLPLVALGAGLVTIGGGLGIGLLAKAAMEGIARQPEAAGSIRGAMIVAAALIEGFTFFALIVCIIATK